MKTTVKLAAAILFGIPLAGVAEDQSKLSCVKDVSYGKEFLAKFPDAGALCQEVKVAQGQKWARFNAEVKNNKDGRITVDFLNKDQEHAGKPMTFEYSPDATLTLENKKVKPASEVKEGDKVVIWVPESRFGLYAKPGAAESQQFKLASSDSTKQR